MIQPFENTWTVKYLSATAVVLRAGQQVLPSFDDEGWAFQ